MMQGKIKKVISSNLIFFLVVLIGAFVIYIINPTLAEEAFSQFFSLLKKIGPILLFVFALVFAFNLFINPKVIAKYMGSEKGFSGWLISIAAGIMSMGNIYIWYPLLADLREKGMKDSLIVTFLYNRSIKLPLVPFIIHYFGLPFMIILTVYIVIFSIINGLLVDKLITFKRA